MGNFVPFVILIFIVILVALLLWYRNKEQQDLQTVGLNILALEHGFEFSKIDSSTKISLSGRKVSYGIRTDIKNIFSKKIAEATIHIFDYTFSRGKNGALPSNQPLNAIGTLIEFNDIQFPTFEIDRKKRFDAFHFLVGFPRIEPQQFPPWAINRISVFGPQSLKYDILKHIQNKGDLIKIVNQPNFLRLFISQNCVVLYQSGKMKNNVNKLQYLESTAMQVVDIFGNSSSIDSWEN